MTRRPHYRSFFSFTGIILSVFCIIIGLTSGAGAEVTLDGSMGPAGLISGPDYLISNNLGTRAGANLFHSFGRFNIATGESATFTNSGAPLNNVIARVTGGPSTIDGLIRSTVTEANLFLLNPAGILFGPNASLDVPADFHASSADYIGFENGERFYTDPDRASILSVAAPEAFGFLGSAPGSISLDRANLKVSAGATLSLVSGDLSAQNDRSDPDYFDREQNHTGPNFYLLNAPGGIINLVSVASPGEVDLHKPDVSSFEQLGAITFNNGANLTVFSDNNAAPAGTIVIRGGRILFQDCGIAGRIAGIEASGSPAGLVDIAGNSFQLNNASIGLFNLGTDKAGDVLRINLNDDFLMTNGSTIISSTIKGNAGHITITADRIRLGDDDPTSSLYRASGFYGYIDSESIFGSHGRGGDIFLKARDILVQNGFAVITASAAETPDHKPPGFGDAGNITIRADRLQLINKAQISSNAFGVGDGGVIDVVANDILISDAGRTDVINLNTMTGLGAQAFDADGGRIQLTAKTLKIEKGGRVATQLFSSGTGADIVIDVDTLEVSGYVADSSLPVPYLLSAIDARVFTTSATGTGGNITITADHILLDNGGAIRTGLYDNAPGDAGNIDITAARIDIRNLGQIYADSFRGSGNSGDINITAENLSITGTHGADPPEPLDFTFTGISTTTAAGRGGTITAAIDNDLILTADGSIRANTLGTGSGGDINFTANNFHISNDGIINSSSTGSGDAGDIMLTATDSLQLDHAAITTEASTEADGGNITISVKNLLNLYYSKITSSVGGGPETTGGNISIDPIFVVLNHSRIVANAYAGTGGNIDIVADTFLADPQSIVDASSQLGVSGTVDIQAPITSISGLVSPLSSEFISASALLRGRCMARLREGGTYSSFIVSGRDGMPLEPGNLLPGIY